MYNILIDEKKNHKLLLLLLIMIDIIIILPRGHLWYQLIRICCRILIITAGFIMSEWF